MQRPLGAVEQRGDRRGEVRRAARTRRRPRRPGSRPGTSAASRSVGDLQVDRPRRARSIASRIAAAAAARHARPRDEREVRRLHDRREHRRLAGRSRAGRRGTRPARRSADGMSVAITRIGERDAHASPTAPSVFAAPGPWSSARRRAARSRARSRRRRTPRPARGARRRAGSSDSRSASHSARLCTPGSPKHTSTPARSSSATIVRAPVGMAPEPTRSACRMRSRAAAKRIAS